MKFTCGENQTVIVSESTNASDVGSMLLERLRYIFYSFLKSVQRHQSLDDRNDPTSGDVFPKGMYLSDFLLFCREIRLIDNRTSHMDFIKEFRKVNIRNTAEADTLVLGDKKESDVCMIPGKTISFQDFVRILIQAMRDRSPRGSAADNDPAQPLFKLHLFNLRNRPADGVRWLLRQSLNPDIIEVKLIILVMSGCSHQLKEHGIDVQLGYRCSGLRDILIQSF